MKWNILFHLLIIITLISCLSVITKKRYTVVSLIEHPIQNQQVKKEIKRKQPTNDLFVEMENWNSNNNYTVAVLGIPSLKVNQLQSNEHLTFLYLPDDVDGNEWFTKRGYYTSLIDFGYQTQPSEFEEYKEQMILNWIFSEKMKMIPEEADYLLVTSFIKGNITQVQMNLHYQLDLLQQSEHDICAIELNKASSSENKIISMNYPTVQFKGISGLLIPKRSFRGIKRMLYSSHYLNSFDLLVQHYCEVENKPIHLLPLITFSPSLF